MKQLVKAAARDLFPQLGIQDPVAEWLNLELPSVRREVDVLARLASRGIVHGELEARPHKLRDQRMLEYFSLIWRETGVMPQQFVLYFGRPKLPSTSGIVQGPSLYYRYTLIDARTLDTTALLSSGIAESNLLALLTANGDPETVVRRLRHHLRHISSHDRGRLEDLFLLLCSLRGHDGRKALNMPVDAMDIPLVRQYWESGKAEGKFEGKREGIAEGKHEGMAEVLIHLIENRFGPLPEPALHRIRHATPEQILNWSTAVSTADCLDHLLR